jgi:hypothetical protein
VEALIPITFFMSVAAVLILRPITKKLGGFIDVMTQERLPTRTADNPDARVVTLLEHMARRLDSMEERLDFTERLVDSPRPPRRLARRAAETHVRGV